MLASGAPSASATAVPAAPATVATTRPRGRRTGRVRVTTSAMSRYGLTWL